MLAVGFSMEELHGSAWHFTLKGTPGASTILFSEPLTIQVNGIPTRNMPFTTVRLYGQRLERTYGWHRAMFELSSE
jgi:hypothetical protein